jgi:hypothetical protein
MTAAHPPKESTMTGKQQIAAELKRLRAALKSDEEPDPVDVAVVEALASREVGELLAPILDDDAQLVGAVLEDAGSVAGVVQLTFETRWSPGASRITQAPAVRALVEVSPPSVLKAVTVLAPAAEPGVRFTAPVGPVPPALRGLKRPTASEALSFNAEARQSFREWLGREGLPPELGTQALGLTTGTKCTSLLCFERTSDDWDTPSASFGSFGLDPRVDPGGGSPI